jgi:hypothetical protein
LRLPCFTSMRLACPPSRNMKKCLGRECGCGRCCLPCGGMVSKARPGVPLDSSSTRFLECVMMVGPGQHSHAAFKRNNPSHPTTYTHPPQHQHGHGALQDRAPGAGGAQRGSTSKCPFASPSLLPPPGHPTLTPIPPTPTPHPSTTDGPERLASPGRRGCRMVAQGTAYGP